ncbi:PREDICTED: nucleolar complex protein 3 homolog isoform X2 [Lupinus angustifolius]|uniref:nucleolar complex protein 3 homolog isoform X2 n=1 Tax=Lupinus angustifolius TaxID=3871 RepID=UPI00092F1484|nr:PREDICTED: nucleolar complex protein 3 homolog isoform X2 [Lupinus angustifolius]
MGKKQKQKIILPPELPPEIPDDEVEVSDEDVQFVKDNRGYASLLSTLDTQSITKHVTRVADAKEDTLEKLYEERSRKSALKKEKEETGLQVDRVDALPIKTLDGKLYYRTAKKTEPENGPGEEEAEEDGNADKGLMKLTKSERRAKLKKMKREEKKQGKEVAKAEVQETPQAAVLAEVKEDLTAEETFDSKKRKLAELGDSLLTDPDSNIKFLKDMLQLCKDNDPTIVKLGLLSLLAVFKDIVPGYRIRLPTEKEMEMKVSKTIRKMRYYESTLLSAYKGYLQRLMILEKKPLFQHVSVRCICSLLDANPHFNFRESLLDATVRNLNSTDEAIRKPCCSTIKSLFTNEGKHGGEATVEAVRLIADHVKAYNCQMQPDSVDVFLSLSFYEDLGKPEKAEEDQKNKYKKNKKRKNSEASNQLPENDRKKSRRELISKTREEVEADYKSASFTPDVMEQRQMQTETLSAVFETYFRILKHTMQSIVARPEANSGALATAVEPHPLLASCLKGLGKFAHLIDLDFMGDLMKHLKILASGSINPGSTSENGSKCLTVSERLQCCIVAFKVMRNNLEALNVDLQDFFVHLYNLIVEYRPGRDQGEVLADALKIMLCDDKQHDMQKTAAFIKRLATLSLCFGSPESMAALVTVKHLLQKNVKCRNLLENDTGGGSVAGTIPKYLPYSTDPNLSGAFATVLWELNLLSKHYHPTISTIASGISTMSAANNQLLLSKSSPQQAFKDLSLEQELSFPQVGSMKLNNKRRKTNLSATSSSIGSTTVVSSFNEDELQKKLSSHFMILHDIKENERLRSELDKTTQSLLLYEQYKKQKKQRSKAKSKLSAVV